ncbi:MAG: UDP-N-acetylmuramate--L-alanine ligase [Bacteroidota bacterium]
MNIDSYSSFFFVGIAGTGMSAIAQYLHGIGKKVSGSDRMFGQMAKQEIQEQFEHLGITCFEQNASGITADTDVVIISTAIEESNIEYQKALSLSIPIVKRSEILAAISNNTKSIAIGGTSGKSTTTAMVFHILEHCGTAPSLITGAGLASLQKHNIPGNAWVGTGEWLVIEADESDGSIVSYQPEIGVVLNIDRDHKEFSELEELFVTFKSHTKTHFIVNQNCTRAAHLSANRENDFGTDTHCGIRGTGFSQTGFSISFTVNDIPCTIPVIGKHNMENALAALAIAVKTDIPLEKAVEALQTFEGIYRRAQLIGKTQNNIYVIDDFAHNPAEVSAIIQACQSIGKRVIAWFQPHGFGPLKFMHEELAEKVAHTLRTQDVFYISSVYYAGGTVAKDIHPTVVSDAISQQNKQAHWVESKEDFRALLDSLVQHDDVILIMGARDPELQSFAQQIFKTIS